MQAINQMADLNPVTDRHCLRKMPHVGNKGVQRISFQKFFNQVAEMLILLQVVYDGDARMAERLKDQRFLPELPVIGAGLWHLLDRAVFL